MIKHLFFYPFFVLNWGEWRRDELALSGDLLKHLETILIRSVPLNLLLCKKVHTAAGYFMEH